MEVLYHVISFNAGQRGPVRFIEGPAATHHFLSLLVQVQPLSQVLNGLHRHRSAHHETAEDNLFSISIPGLLAF
jgi:hypothetical protein